MRRVVVVTMLGAGACAKAVDPSDGGLRPGIPRDPSVAAPSPDPAGPAPVPSAPVAPPPPVAPPTPVVLNGSDPDRGPVFRAVDGTCHVNVAPAVRTNLSFQPPDRVPVECPPHMRDPSWDACAEGVVRTVIGGEGCSCAVIGNPPPPPRQIPCPKGPE